ncbi:hypothetical protein [uncultured Imperialibacter sp.]|uniref:hypothetical protein n=1 Tax=uncultured Imperialibacter sp. TaxID=1672639 RepID=UPI0030DDA701|tara:strand:+ start:17559 stop:17981 length:423 start_codon:yes stop_codon:yes gene_type:complete
MRKLDASKQIENLEFFKSLPESDRFLYCPISLHRIQQSEYLSTIFDDPKTLWLANLITHYRHNHISSWNKCWGWNGNYYRQNWFGDYDDEKKIVNERAKRELVRNGHLIFRYMEVTKDHWCNMRDTSPETIKVIDKLLVA